MKQVFKIASVLTESKKKINVTSIAFRDASGANAIQTRRKSQEGYGYD
jgi:hypothetical protein